MPSPAAVAPEPSNIRERIIIALDVPTGDDARQIVAELSGAVGAFKVGMQLFTAAGPDLVREFTSAGHRIFLDLKFHDIPNTVANAGVEAAKLGVWMFNIHASGGGEMMRRTADAVAEYCEREGSRRPRVIAVTVLTSSDGGTLAETGIGNDIGDQVMRLARLAHVSGLDGVVASPIEVSIVKKTVATPGFMTVTPGIRSKDATSDDQRRVTSIGEAFAGGSEYVVIGRPVIAAANRLDAVEALVREAADHR